MCSLALGFVLSLIDEVIDLAVDNQRPLAVLLRKSLVLAHKLKNDKLKQWVTKELNGYEETDELPSYREVGAQAKGHFVGPFGASASNVPIAPASLEEDHQLFASKAFLTEPVASYESLLGHKGNPQIPWPTNLTLLYQRRIMQGYALMSAWQMISQGAIAAIIDTIRTRLLQFALEIKDELEELGTEDINQISSEKVETSVVNHIYGGSVIISGNANSITQNNIGSVSKNDFGSLSGALSKAGIGGGALNDLQLAMASDKKEIGGNVKGSRVSSWLDGLSQYATPAVFEVVTKAVEAYYGI